MVDPPSRARLERKLARAVARAVTGFGMIAPGDRIMVALSGGKDSYVLHDLLVGLSRRAPVRFSVLGVHLDQGFPGHDPTPLVEHMRARGHDVHLARDDTYSATRALVPEGKSLCSLCAKLRRAVLYRLCDELGCAKLALAHHRDDAIVTLLLNLVFSGQLKAMPPKLRSDDGRHVVIRPLVYCAEQDIAELAALVGYPLLPAALCGAQPTQERRRIAELMQELEHRCPGARANMLAALANVRPSHLLDPGLWSKLGIHEASSDDEPALDGDGPAT